ncbi:MAG: hypothetical protein JXR97_07810 [Planctomycetes bacterium]|nr:hypothetical protein [Planctomycetota bacterium]
MKLVQTLALIGIFLLAFFSPAYAEDNLKINIARHAPCNIFETGVPAQLTASFNSPMAGKAEAKLTVVDYFRKVVLDKQIPLTLTKGGNKVELEFGKLPQGYYEATLIVTLTNEKGEAITGTQTACLGVADFVSRTVKEVRDGDYRIGVKMWYTDKAWWRGNLDWSEDEAVSALVKLGLQWTRTEMLRGGSFPTTKLMNEYPMNVVMKVESYPKEFFDVKRYGTIEEWEKVNGRGWSKKTVPMKEPYQNWLREKLKDIPPEQNVFEIWNEAWDKMPAEDLATISNYVTEVILQERPDAIIGPNLLGTTSPFRYDAQFIKAGGMKGMKMVALHPYSGHVERAQIREYSKWLEEQTGRHIDLYTTEYGTHSCPEGPSKKSEESQTQKVVRFTIGLYAEGMKTLIPHVLGQREENPTYHEDWFGFIRLNNEPKSVLLGQATCAKMIDGSEYIGDLWFGEGVAAFLFNNKGAYTLALFTREGSKEITIPVGQDKITLTDIVGTRQTLTPKDGAITVKVSEDTIYLSGFSPEIAKTATKELNPKRWPQEEKEAWTRNVRHAPKFSVKPSMDGDLSEWKDKCQFALVNPKVNGNDASGFGYLAWDEDNLYVAVDMRDDQIYNTQHRPKLYREDSMELFVSTVPRDKYSGYGENDYQFFITPTSAEGKVVVGRLADRESGEVVDVEGAKYNVGKTKIGWRAELALPWKSFSKFDAKAGGKVAIEVRVNDADTTHKRWKIDPEDSGYIPPEEPAKWSLVLLED